MKNQLKEFVEKHSFKEEALDSIDKVLDVNIKSDKKNGIDFLNGHDKSELIYEFGRYELQVDKNDNCRIAVRINIYSKKLYGPNYDVPVGHYIELKDSETGEHLDEFFIFDWYPVDLNVDSYIESINKVIPLEYYLMNKQEYEFATYVNHILSLFQGRQYDSVVLFIKRSLDYIESPEKQELQQRYLIECLRLFRAVINYIKNNELVISEKLLKYNLQERLKTKS